MLFFLGFAIGVLFTILLAHGVTRGISKTSQEETDELFKDIELSGSVKYRFARVNEITQAQIELISRTDRPSASAAHSRHKNNIVGQIKALEEEKMEIFRSILKDGVDPTLQIIIDGQPQAIKMSEAVAMHEGDKPYPESKTEPKSTRTNGLRLVHTSEEANESGNPEIPSPRS